MEAEPGGGVGVSPPRVLIADDQVPVIEALRMLLKGDGYQTEGVSSPGEILAALESKDFDVILMDLNYARDTTSGAEGLDLLSRIRVLDRTLPVIVMTAWGSMELVIKAMQRGASDFITKPWENARVLASLRSQVERRRALRRRQQDEQREMLEAQEVQRGLMLRKTPQIRGCEISAAWRPARFVGGDYLDVMKFGENRAGFCIADVAGKGLPAALLMSNLQAAIKALASDTVAPRDLCGKLNRIICENVSAGRFITFFYALLDTDGKRMIYSNAGHNPPILLRRDGVLVRLDQGGVVLGEFGDSAYAQGEVGLHSGDRLLFFTDGITEAENSQGEEFGEERLIDILVNNRHLNAVELQKRLIAGVSEYCDHKFRDDATLIVLSVA
jgi:sigma-B regulation protein RsbU (phosphoserine phosphatase)